MRFSPKPLKILLVGLGSIGQRHARNLRAILGDNLELLAYRVRRLDHVINPDLTINPRENVEAKYGIKTYLNLKHALDAKPDAVFITNPNSMHIPVALAAAETGCHLFIEKPLSHDFEDVPRLIDLVKKNRLICLVGYQLRFHPGFKQMQSLLATKAFGKVLAARIEFGEFLPSWHQYEDYRQYHASRKDQGGGVVLSHIHDLDCIYALFGLPLRLFAVGGKLSSLEIDVEDTVNVLMQCGSRENPIPVHLHQDYVQKPPIRKYQILLENGSIVWDYYAKRICALGRMPGEHQIFNFENFDRNHLFVDEITHFLACLAGTETPVVGIEDGANSLMMALAVKRSMETGQAVDLGQFARR